MRGMFKIPFWGRRGNQDADGKSEVRLVVGLGNPGEKYDQTFHNVGFDYVDCLVSAAGVKFKKYDSFEYAKFENLVFLKPLTYMNRSGEAVRKALKHFGLKPRALVVAHDDSDLPLGEYKISSGQGSAGHKGVESIIKYLKTNSFTRIRIGVRSEQKGPARLKAGDFVLRKVGPKERAILDKLFSEIEAVDLQT